MFQRIHVTRLVELCFFTMTGTLSRMSRRSVLFVVILAGCAAPPLNKVQPIWTPDFPATRIPQRPNATDEGEGPRVVISISGGGTRAANIGLGMLLALDSIPATLDKSASESLLRRVRYASTVSGGGLPVAAYLALMFTGGPAKCRAEQPATIYEALLRDRGDPEAKLPLLRKAWIGALFDSMNPMTWSGSVANSDVFSSNYFTPLTSARCDNGLLQPLYLSDAIENNLVTHIPNATVSLNGDVFPFTESHLKKVQLQGVLTRTGATYNWAPIDPSDESISLASRVPYATAIAASASFPPLLSDSRLRVRGPDSKPAYLHLTDGGQADDNGTGSALKALENLPNDSGSDSPVLYLALDALPDKGGFVSPSSDPADMLNVLLERNMDLPRYGPKRDLALQVYSDESQARSTALDDVGRLYVAHIGVWRYSDDERPVDSKKSDESLVKVPTLEAGRKGLTVEQQSAMITAGIVLTYEALFSDALTKSIRVTIKKQARAVVQCLFATSKSKDCPDSAASWSALQESARDITTKGGSSAVGSEDGLVEFARKAKLNDWASLVERASRNLAHIHDLLSAYADSATSGALIGQSEAVAELERAEKDYTARNNENLTDYVFENFKVSFKNQLEAIKIQQSAFEDDIKRIRDSNEMHRQLLAALKHQKVDLKECTCGSTFSCSTDKFTQIGTPSTTETNCQLPVFSNNVDVEDTSTYSTIKRKAIENFQDIWEAISTYRNYSDDLTKRYANVRRELCGHKIWLSDLALQPNVLVTSELGADFRQQTLADIPCPPERDAPGISDSQVTLELKHIKTAITLAQDDTSKMSQCLSDKRTATSKRFESIIANIHNAEKDTEDLVKSLEEKTIVCSVALQKALNGDSEKRSQIGICVATLRRAVALNFAAVKAPIRSTTSDVSCGDPMTPDALKAKIDKDDASAPDRPKALSKPDESLIAPYEQSVMPVSAFARQITVDSGADAVANQDAIAMATSCFSERRKMTYGQLVGVRSLANRDCSKLLTYRTPNTGDASP